METARLEIACFNAESAVIAFENGAHRIELCREKSTEGLTPFYDTIREVRTKVDCLMHVMLRPRPGSYVYTDEEFAILQKQVRDVKELGVDGLVFGTMDKNGLPHIDQNKALVELVSPLPATFHRAFDEISDQSTALEILIRCGYKTLLTSAGYKAAIEGANTLRKLIDQSSGRINIMPGGGVRSGHLAELKEKTGAVWFHSSAITDGGEIASPEEVQALVKALL